MAVLFVFQTVNAYAQNADLRQAEKLASQGNTAEALRIYGRLMEELPVSADLFNAFDGYFRLESELDKLLPACGSFLSRTENAVLPPGLAEKIAGLYELCGRTSEASSLYSLESKDHGSIESFESAVRLLLEMNETAEAAAMLATRPGDGETALSGQAALQRGEAATARSIFEKELEKPDSFGESLRAMFGLYSSAEAQGDAKGRDEAAKRLINAYPRSPEAAIVGANDTRIRAAAVPARYFDASDVSTLSSKERTDASTEDGGVSVQAGSFAVRENAEDMRNVLAGKGFPAEIRETGSPGRILYRVYAARSVDEQTAKKVVIKLQEMGFYGYIVTDED